MALPALDGAAEAEAEALALFTPGSPVLRPHSTGSNWVLTIGGSSHQRPASWQKLGNS